jgi:hypothetical protein
MLSGAVKCWTVKVIHTIAARCKCGQLPRGH